MPVGSNWAGDDHRTVASGRQEHQGLHTQVTAEEASARGWYFREDAHHSLIPDTRRCRCHGTIMYEAKLLTTEQRELRSQMSTNVLLGKPQEGWPQESEGHRW